MLASRLGRCVRYLEELIRAAAEGRGDELPPTVLAMVQARLMRLDSGARRVLRAASIFGSHFWRDGVAELLLSDPVTADVEHWLHTLTEMELITPHTHSRLRGGGEFSFRHGLVRDAAYGLLTDDRRRVYHRVAAEFLLRAGEKDPLVLAEHHERGDRPMAAAAFLLQAAERAHLAGEPAIAVAYAERGLQCQPDPQTDLGILSLLCQSFLWRNQLATSAKYADEVLKRAAPGSVPWVLAASAKLVHTSVGGRDEFLATMDEVARVEPVGAGAGAQAFALAIGIYVLDSYGDFARGEHYLNQLHARVDPIAHQDPVALAWLQRAHTHREAWVCDRPERGLRYARAARDNFVAAGHTRGALVATAFVGIHAWYLGDLDLADSELRKTLSVGDDLGLVSSLRTLVQVQVLTDMARPLALGEAKQIALAFIADSQTKSALARARSHWALADVLLQTGWPQEALDEADKALPLLSDAPLDAAGLQTVRADAMLQLRRLSQAHELVDATMAQMAQVGVLATSCLGLRLRVVHVEVLLAQGDVSGAESALAAIDAGVTAQAAQIEHEELRETFLHRHPLQLRWRAQQDLLRLRADA